MVDLGRFRTISEEHALTRRGGGALGRQDFTATVKVYSATARALREVM